MICDGWGYSQIEAFAYYLQGKTPPASIQDMNLLAMATYSADVIGYNPDLAWRDFNYVKEKATDSAASATAFSTGILTSNGVLGLDPSGAPLKHITSAAKALGKSCGLVTTVQISHATPAGFIVHIPHRSAYTDIAQQMLSHPDLDVLMGAGHPYYDDNGARVDDSAMTEERYQFVGGSASWHQIVSGIPSNTSQASPWYLLENREDFIAITRQEPPERVLGIAKVENTLQQRRSGDTDAAAFNVPLIDTVPTLQEMSAAALHILSRNSNGFFLMIEGGAIDWTGHANQSGRLIEEMSDFMRAVEEVRSWIERMSSYSETLLIITGDHECGYLLGPESGPEVMPVENRGAGAMPGMKWHSTDHTNSLIPLFFEGAGEDGIFSLVYGDDPVRGPFVRHLDIGKYMHHLWIASDTE